MYIKHRELLKMESQNDTSRSEKIAVIGSFVGVSIVVLFRILAYLFM